MNTASILMNSTKSYFLFVCCLFILSKLGLSQHKTIVAPDDMVVSCGFQFTTKDLTDTSSTLFGKLQLDSSQRKKLISLDVVCKQFCETNKKTGYPGPTPPAPSKPPASAKACAYFAALFDSLHKNRVFEMVWGYDGYLSNPLELKYSLEISDLRFCNQGKILRIFSTQGPNQTLLRDTQTIWVVNCHPFYINTLDLCDPNDDVVIPDCDLKQVLNGCMIPNRDTSSYPKIPRDSCRSIGIDFVDSIGVQLPEHYFYVLRHWQLTDWCQFDPTDPDSKGRFNITDTIFVVDDQSPKTSIDLTDCSEADSTGFAQVMIQAHATDNCTSDDYISYSYLIDLNADGMGPYDGYDLSVGPLRPREIAAGKIPINQDNPFATYSTNPINASGNYPIGKHKIVYRTVDGLNNESRDSAFFEIGKQEPPEVICPSDELYIPVNLPQSVVLDVKTLLSNVVDNCTIYSKLKIYLDGQSNKTQDIISCDDFIEAGNPDTLSRNYKIYVEDASGNIKVCSILVNYIPLNVCDIQNKRLHSGRIISQRGKPIENARILVRSELQQLILDQRACSGHFEFSTFSPSRNYNLNVLKEDALTNGVDVLDAFIINQHVVGQQTLSNPFDLFAADLHKNQSISEADVVNVLKIILGYNGIGINPGNVWAFYNAKDSLLISETTALTDTSLTCIGVKSGDLTGDALTKCGESYNKPTTCLNLIYPVLQAEKEKKYLIPITSSNYNSIIGFQSGFKLNDERLKLNSILKVKLRMQPGNLNPYLILDTVHFNFAFIANSPALFTIAPNEVLFYLDVTALEDGHYTNFISATDQTCKTVAYNVNQEALNICMNSILSNSNELKNSKIEIFPNPFSDKLQIRFPQNFNKSNLQIVDVFGRQIYSSKINSDPNQILEIPGNLFPNKGIFYIKLQSDEERLVKVIVRE